MSARQFLKSVAGLFAASYRPYAFGAFGTPGVREVANAESSGRLIRYRAAGTGAEGAAILKVLGVDSRHRDFCGRTCDIPRGSVFVQHLCTTPGAEAEVAPELIRIIKERAAGARTWLELHEENIALREQFEVRHEFTHVMTKIMASSDIRGLYVHPPGRSDLPPLPRHEIVTLRCLDSKFLLSKELTAIRNELSRYTEAGNIWGQHYSHYNKRRSWTAFAIRGYKPEDATFIAKPAEMSKAWKAAHPEMLTVECVDTAAAAYFTRTLEVLKRVPGDKERVRFMRLASGNGELSRHADITDRDAGTSDGRVVRLHIPLATHEDVIFEGWGLRGEHERTHFAEAGLYYLDQRKPHRVVNSSPVERVHLVVDVYASGRLREWLS